MKYRVKQLPMAGGVSDYVPQYSIIGIFWQNFSLSYDSPYWCNHVRFISLDEANRFISDTIETKQQEILDKKAAKIAKRNYKRSIKIHPY